MPNTSIETAISTSTTKTRRRATYPIIGAAPALGFQRDALQLEPLHRRRAEVLDLLTDSVHVGRRIGDDPRHGLLDHGLKALEQGLARRLIISLTSLVE